MLSYSRKFKMLFLSANLIFILNILFSVGNPEIRKKLFLVAKNKRILNSTVLENVNVFSHIDCAIQCTNSEYCKAATYTGITNSCSFYGDPWEMEPSLNTAVLWKTGNQPRDCGHIGKGSLSGVYRIYPGQSPGFLVYCDMVDDGGGWTVLQKRLNGTTEFRRSWDEYKHGFGDVKWEYWLGNEHLHILTSKKNYTLKFDIEAFTGETRFALYTVFRVDNEASNYTLRIGGYSGTAGDAMKGPITINGMMFSTPDRDNDEIDKTHCADTRNAGWWFRNCCQGNINGHYELDGASGYGVIYWRPFLYFRALKATSMKIRGI